MNRKRRENDGQVIPSFCLFSIRGAKREAAPAQALERQATETCPQRRWASCRWAIGRCPSLQSSGSIRAPTSCKFCECRSRCWHKRTSRRPSVHAKKTCCSGLSHLKSDGLHWSRKGLRSTGKSCSACGTWCVHSALVTGRPSTKHWPPCSNSTSIVACHCHSLQLTT